MSKQKKLYTCTHCDAQFPKWLGQCLECQSWGTLQESTTPTHSKHTNTPTLSLNSSPLYQLGSITAHPETRLQTKIGEVDRVFGGGIVHGSLSLLGGEPGIGKSTLVLQLANALKKPLLYASGEESAQQVKLRVDRLGFNLDHVSFLAENRIEYIVGHAKAQQPALLIVDSIQTLYSENLPSEPGSINQVRACTVMLLELAKQHDITVLIIGHVTKEGTVAGPKTLEHLVDTVLYLEGSRHDGYRILRSIKNRFGSTDELGVFEMTAQGLHEIINPSQLFFNPSDQHMSGCATTVTMEGSRPFVIEIQSLVTKTQFGYPQRKTAGFDSNRLQMLLAVLQKRAGKKCDSHDVHLNVVGGFTLKDTTADLAVCLSLVSSLQDIVPKEPFVALGEVGLGGELRPVPQLQKRIDEALRSGFTKIIIPDGISVQTSPALHKVKNLSSAIALL